VLTIIRFIINLAVVTTAILSDVFWVLAARANVDAKEAREGVGNGGTRVNVRDHTGAIVDFLQTYALQSKWNARAAFMSAHADRTPRDSNTCQPSCLVGRDCCLLAFLVPQQSESG